MHIEGESSAYTKQWQHIWPRIPSREHICRMWSVCRDLLLIFLSAKPISLDKWQDFRNGSAGWGIWYQVWCPEFNFCKPHRVEENGPLEAILWPLEYTVLCTHTSTHRHKKQTNKTFRKYLDYIAVFTPFCETVDSWKLVLCKVIIPLSVGQELWSYSELSPNVWEIWWIYRTC